MDIDEFLDTETAKLGGKAKIVSSPGASSQGGSLRKLEEETLFEKLEMIKEQVKDKKILSAVRGFESLKSQYTDMTRKLLSENRYIFNQLLEINQDLAKSMHNQKGDVTKKSQLVKKLVADAIAQLNSGNISTANKINIEIQELLREIPDVFVEEKGEIKNEVTSFTVLLTRHLQKAAKVEFADKKKLLESTIFDAYRYIEKSGGYLPYATFNDVNKMFMMLPDGFVYEKIMLYIDILKLFRSSSLGEETRGVLETITKMHQNMHLPSGNQRPGRVALKDVGTPAAEKPTLPKNELGAKIEAAASQVKTEGLAKVSKPAVAEPHKETLKPVAEAPKDPPLSIDLTAKKKQEEVKPKIEVVKTKPVEEKKDKKGWLSKVFGSNDESKKSDSKDTGAAVKPHPEKMELKNAAPKIDAPPVIAGAVSSDIKKEEKKEEMLKPLSLHGDEKMGDSIPHQQKSIEPKKKKVAEHSKLSIDL